MDNGQYVQVLASTAKIFEEDNDIKATPVANIGTVQRVTERPGFGINTGSVPSIFLINKSNTFANVSYGNF